MDSSLVGTMDSGCIYLHLFSAYFESVDLLYKEKESNSKAKVLSSHISEMWE